MTICPQGSSNNGLCLFHTASVQPSFPTPIFGTVHICDTGRQYRRPQVFEVVNASRVASPTSSLSWRRTVDGPGLTWDYWIYRWFAVALIHVLTALATCIRATATLFSLRPPLHGRSPTPSIPPRFYGYGRVRSFMHASGAGMRRQMREVWHYTSYSIRR